MVKKEKGGSKFKQVFIYLLGVGGGRDGEYTMKDIKMGSGLVMRQFFNWAAPSEFVTYRLCEQRRFRRACASAQSRQTLRCSLIQAVSEEEPSDRKPNPWPL